MNARQPQNCSFPPAVPVREEEAALGLVCFSSPQRRVRPDPAELELPFNQLRFPERLHPANPPAITITAPRGVISP